MIGCAVRIALDSRFSRTPDGAVWSGTFQNSIWQRYRCSFDVIEVVGRVRDVDSVDESLKRVDGDGVVFKPLPFYHGPGTIPGTMAAVPTGSPSGSLTKSSSVILRVPSNLAHVLEPRLRAKRIPFAVEVVADPWDIFSPGHDAHVLRPFFRRYYTAKLRRHCREADASLYVTERALQARYPAKKGSLTAGVSDVDLTPAAFRANPRSGSSFENARPFRLVSVGAFDLLYKGQDVLIRAFSRLRHRVFELVMVGDGVRLPEIRRLAHEMGCSTQVRFLGQLPSGDSVRQVLDESHLFVLPSRQEGLPRAMLEAMARALPCIASAVGGIPEIIDYECLVPVGDSHVLARKISTLASHPAELARLSRRNLVRSQDFRDERLSIKRKAFLDGFRGIAQARRASVRVPQGAMTS